MLIRYVFCDLDFWPVDLESSWYITWSMSVWRGGSISVKFSRSRGRPTRTIFARIDRPVNAIQLCRWQYWLLTQRSFVADFLQVKCNLRRKTVLCCFSPPMGGLGTTYNVHLRLIGKLAVDFLLVFIELFSLGVTAEALRANIDWKSAFSLQQRPFDTKFQVVGVAPH